MLTLARAFFHSFWLAGYEHAHAHARYPGLALRPRFSPYVVHVEGESRDWTNASVNASANASVARCQKEGPFPIPCAWNYVCVVLTHTCFSSHLRLYLWLDCISSVIVLFLLCSFDLCIYTIHTRHIWRVHTTITNRSTITITGTNIWTHDKTKDFAQVARIVLCFICLFVCLFVCLSVCFQDTNKPLSVHTAVKRKNPTVFHVSNFASVQWKENLWDFTTEENVIKVALWEKISSWESLRMSISNFPCHMRSIKLNFSATVLTLDLKATIFVL